MCRGIIQQGASLPPKIPKSEDLLAQAITLFSAVTPVKSGRAALDLNFEPQTEDVSPEPMLSLFEFKPTPSGGSMYPLQTKLPGSQAVHMVDPGLPITSLSPTPTLEPLKPSCCIITLPSHNHSHSTIHPSHTAIIPATPTSRPLRHPTMTPPPKPHTHLLG